MIARPLLLAAALLAASGAAALAQTRDDVIAAPVLRANVRCPAISCGSATSSTMPAAPAQIAIYRAPDLGTTGTLPVAQVLNTLRAHQVIGVDTRDLKEISVTRLARTLEGKDIEQQVARALERRNGLGDAANLTLTFDRDPGDLRLDAAVTGAHAADVGALRRRATAASTSPSKSPTRTAPRRPSCASPARRSRPSRPRCWRAMSSATTC